jgi:hypothetical protein
MAENPTVQNTDLSLLDKDSGKVPTSELEQNSEPEKIPYVPSSWPLKEMPCSNDHFIKLAILSVSHRTGSTLLQRLCNTRKGTLVWGEHGGLLLHYAKMYDDVAFFSIRAGYERTDYFNSGEDPTNLWIANMTPEVEYVRQATVESARMFLNTLYREYSESHDMIGFKEVAYGRMEVELIRRCYPEASIFFLVRNPADMWNSTKREWYDSIEKWTSKWNDNVRDFLELSKGDSHAYFLRYEDMVQRKKETMSIISDVAKITSEQIESVMNSKVGSSPIGINESERRTIEEHCREQMTAIGYL